MFARRQPFLYFLAVASAFMTIAGGVRAEGSKKPNILVIWGDDIGQFNVSAYNRGMMGYRTPNIDSIAERGAPRRIRAPLLFNDSMYSSSNRL